MTMFKRALLCIIRNKTRSVLLLLIIFVMGFLMSSSLVIEKACGGLEEQFLKETGLAVMFSYDFEDNVEDNALWLGSKKDRNSTFSNVYKTLNMFSDNPYVTDYGYNIYMHGFSDCLYKESSEYRWKNVFDFSDPYAQYTRPLMWGVDRTEFSELADYVINVTDGRSFTKEEVDDGENVCVVNEKLRIDKDGVMSEIRVGDTIPVKLVVFSYPNGAYNTYVGNELYSEYEYLKVIGIVHYNSDNDKAAVNEYRDPEMTIYMPNKTVMMIHEHMDNLRNSYESQKNDLYGVLDDSALGITNYYLQITDFSKTAEVLYQFEEYADVLSEHGDHPEYVSLVTTKDAYDNISWAVKGLGTFADVFHKLTVLFFIIVTVFVVVLQIRNRKKEVGILLSNGEKKSKVIIQMILELFIVAAVGITLSILAGYRIAEPVGAALMSNTIEAKSETMSTDDRGNRINRILDVDEETLVEMFTVKPDYNSIVYQYFEGLSCVMISAVIICYVVVLTKPRRIMLDGD